MKTIIKGGLESRLGFKVAERVNVLGVDTASKRTGWCNLIVKNNVLTADYGFINNISTNPLLNYNSLIKFFQQLTDKKDKVIIEEAYYFRNAKVFQKLSRAGMIVYQCAYVNGCDENNIKFLLASQARNGIGLKNKKKEIVHQNFKEKFGINIGDEDCIDAFILALNGVKFEPEQK